ncbi:Ent-kaurene synthase, partial [Thalictrum thalictroides]
CSQGTKERISKMFNKVDQLSVSSYDTAWVAMVPCLDSPRLPYFPQCLNWVLENQHPDGSWGLTHHDRHPFLLKDTLSSTLASILALKKWNIGEQHVNKGLQFVTSNLASATDMKQHNPIGFDIIFPEGMGNAQDWQDVMKYQRQNGSLFNSPASTAAVAAHLLDSNCLDYLHLVLQRFGNTVLLSFVIPTAYPLDIYTQLCMVDSLESLGIARHFTSEIESVLHKTYSCWLIKDEHTFLDIATCAMAFRILCMHGYDISADVLAQYSDREGFLSNTLAGYLKDTGAALNQNTRLLTGRFLPALVHYAS